MIKSPNSKIAFEVLERDKWKCQLCGVDTPKELRGTSLLNAPEVDHIIPRRSPNSTNDLSNLRCLCRRCNQPREVQVKGGHNQAREFKVKGGYNQSRESKAKGWSKGGKIGGLVSGKIAAERGQIQALAKSGVGLKGIHTRWHVRRNIVSTTCKFCVGQTTV